VQERLRPAKKLREPKPKPVLDKEADIWKKLRQSLRNIATRAMKSDDDDENKKLSVIDEADDANANC